jgi:hypothetical protein
MNRRYPWFEVIEKFPDDGFGYDPLSLRHTRGIKWHLPREDREGVPEVFGAWKTAGDNLDDLVWVKNILTRFIRIRRYWWWRAWYMVLDILSTARRHFLPVRTPEGAIPEEGDTINHLA